VIGLPSEPVEADVPSIRRDLIKSMPSVPGPPAIRSLLIRTESLPVLNQAVADLELVVVVIAMVSTIARRTLDRLEALDAASSTLVVAREPETIKLEEERPVLAPAALPEPTDTKRRRRRAKVSAAA
jgi:hypothetical protein